MMTDGIQLMDVIARRDEEMRSEPELKPPSASRFANLSRVRNSFVPQSRRNLVVRLDRDWYASGPRQRFRRSFAESCGDRRGQRRYQISLLLLPWNTRNPAPS